MWYSLVLPWNLLALPAAEGKYVQEFRLCVEFICLTNMKRICTA